MSARMFSTDVYFDIKSWNIYRDVIYLITIIFTSTVNILVIITIKQIKDQKTLKNDFLMNIACSDVLIALIYMSTNYIIHGFPMTLSKPLCKLIAFIQGTLICCSIWSLLVASIDRNVAFMKGTQFGLLDYWVDIWVTISASHLFCSFLFIYYFLLSFLGIKKSLTL